MRVGVCVWGGGVGGWGGGVNRGGYRSKSQPGKLTLEKIILPSAAAGIRTRDLSIRSPGALNARDTEPSPLPKNA